MNDFLRRLVQWLIELLSSRKAPKPGKLEVSFDMDLIIDLVHPTHRTDERPMPLDELSHYTVEIGVRDEDRFYTLLDPSNPTYAVGSTASAQHRQTEIDNGEWFVRVKWFDKRGQASAPVVASTTVGTSLAPPKAGTVTLTTV